MDLINFIWKIKKFGLENVFGRYYSTYPGRVTKNIDPENRGRIKVIVPDISDEQEIANWVEPQLRTAGRDANISSTTNGKYGSFFPPKVGDYVWVQFRLGDIRSPVYTEGGWWGKNEIPEFISSDRKNAVFISRFGHKITVDETETKAKINIETNKTYQFEINESDNDEQINIICGKSKNKLQFYDKEGAEYILLQDKNGDTFKWDLPAKKWTILFKGDKEETIDLTSKLTVQKSVEHILNDTLKETVAKQVEQIFNDLWKVQVAKTISMQAGIATSIKQPKIAIGDGSNELLLAIYEMMVALGACQILTPVGPAAPVQVSANWPQVQAQMNKIQQITGGFI